MNLRRILSSFGGGLLICFALTLPVKAELINFVANLDGGQEVPPNASTASGFATFTLDTTALTLTYEITIIGLDLDGLQTPDDPNDDVTGLHFHNQAVGVNGPIDFGVLGLMQDLDDLVVDPVAGTVSGIWEETDPANEALSLNIDELLAGNFYVNVHTVAIGSGEIRGQLVRVTEPPTLALLVISLFGLAMSRLRRRS